MKLAILGTRGIPARYGGFETFAEKLALGLVQRGHDTTVYCERGNGGEPVAYRGVTLRYCAAPQLGPLSTILFDINCLLDARNKFDVVYMLGYGAAAFCRIPRTAETEVWINPDGIEWARAKWNWAAKLYFRAMEWFSVRTADRVIADAESVARHLAERHRSIKPCSVIRYGCDLIDTPPNSSLLREWNLGIHDYYLVVCRLEPENHVLEILEGFRNSRSRKKLVVVGDHHARTRYAAQLRLIQDDRIRMIGTIYHQEKLACLRYYSFAYFHGHSVGGTNPSLLEAMGCGNLVFAHDNRFNRETLAETGTYFDTRANLAQAIDRAEQNPGPLECLRRATKARARSHYRWSDVISQYAALLEECEQRRKAA